MSRRKRVSMTWWVSAAALVFSSSCPGFQSFNQCFTAPMAPALIPAIGIAGQPVTGYATVRLGPDGLDGLSATAELTSPSNTTLVVPATLSTLTCPGPLAQFTFTPTEPGTWHLQLIVEPTLQRVQAQLLVATDRSTTPRTTVRSEFVTGTCEPQPFRTRSGTVLCHQPPGNTTRALAPDGGLTTFVGLDLMVVGDSVWSSGAEGLELFRDVGGRLVRVGVVREPVGVRRFTNETTVIIDNDGLTGVRATLTDGGLASATLPWGRSPQVLVDGDALWGLSSREVCNDASCMPLASLIALSARGLLTFDSRTTPQALTFVTRPLDVRTSQRETLLLPVELSLDVAPAFDSDFASGALVDPSNIGLRVPEGATLMPVALDGGLVLAWYGPGRVLGLAGNHVVLETDAGVTFAEW